MADNYLTTYSADNWVMYEGKPLLVIFDGAPRVGAKGVTTKK